ncbi:hypothetical protein E2C01_021012 [Portunus trituberculatus]|uniref:Uncharacterized protein n=1 Tax=Portunus trituberculatus TaxID=210409 RepID=A0A5B7E244_PORTR|nr:hypothetical protein [Portunus trituberculatus]
MITGSSVSQLPWSAHPPATSCLHDKSHLQPPTAGGGGILDKVAEITPSGIHHHMTLLTLHEEGICEADWHFPHECRHWLTLLQGVNCDPSICLHCHIWPMKVSQCCHRCQVACISKVASMVEDL